MTAMTCPFKVTVISSSSSDLVGSNLGLHFYGTSSSSTDQACPRTAKMGDVNLAATLDAQAAITIYLAKATHSPRDKSLTLSPSGRRLCAESVANAHLPSPTLPVSSTTPPISNSSSLINNTTSLTLPVSLLSGART